MIGTISNGCEKEEYGRGRRQRGPSQAERRFRQACTEGSFGAGTANLPRAPRRLQILEERSKQK